MLKPAGIWVAHHATWMHHMGPDGRGDCRTSLPYVTNYASFMSMRAPNGWHVPNPGWHWIKKRQKEFYKMETHLIDHFPWSVYMPFLYALYWHLLTAPFGLDRTYSVNMVGQFDERPSYIERVALFTSSGSLPNSFIVAPTKTQYQLPKYPNGHDAMIEKGFQLRYCRSHNDTDRCISRDNFPSRIETQGQNDWDMGDISAWECLSHIQITWVFSSGRNVTFTLRTDMNICRHS